MPGEHRLDIVPGEQIQQPRPSGLVDVVVGAALIRRQHIGGIVNEGENPPATACSKFGFEPGALLRLFRQVRVEQQRIDDDAAQQAAVERVVVRAKGLAVVDHVVRAHDIGRHPVHRLVAHVVVARHQVQRYAERRRDLLEAARCLAEHRQPGHRVHDVAQVHHEFRRRIERCDLGHGVACAPVGARVGLERRSRAFLVLVHMGVGDDCEREQLLAGRFARTARFLVWVNCVGHRC